MLTTRPAASAAALEGSAGAKADDVLLRRLRAGEAAAFEAVVRTEGPRLLAVARRLLRREREAQEVVQEAFLTAFRALDAFTAEVRLATWLHRIAVSVALARLRSRAERARVSIEDFLPTFIEGGHLAAVPPPWRETAGALHGEDRDFVRACIDLLPDSHRTVLILRDVEELDADETARLLGLGPAVARERLHRARQALRSLLEPRFQAAMPPPAWPAGDSLSATALPA